MKNIVLLSDGTGNSAAKLFRTNVWRLYQALDLTDETRQIAYYDDGVGTSSFKPLAVLGGAAGYGLKRNVLDLYTFLCRNYREGDRVYCFGFSRGAFTIRVLTGLINSQGLIVSDTEHDLRKQAVHAFTEYRRSYRSLITSVTRHLPKSRKARRPPPPINFLGLWDTVAAYGLPFDELTRAWSFIFPLAVPDRNPCPIVERACHALALDDERKTFHPVLWNEARLDPKNHDPRAAHIGQEQITQVWFAGAHSDVGGGYAEDALAHISLDWMMGQAHERGLQFDAHAWQRVKAVINVDGMLHDSRRGTGAAYRYLPRKLETLINDRRNPHNQVVIERPKIHESVLRRIANGDDGYAPIVLPANYAVMDSAGNIHDLPQARSPVLPETVEEAKTRAAKQRSVWDLVALRRVLYFCTLMVGLLLAAFPLVFAAMKTCTDSWCWLAWPIRTLGVLLPDFLAPWFRAFESHSLKFWLLFALLVFLLKRSARVRTLIGDRMRALWRRQQSRDTPAALKLLVALYRPVPGLVGWAMVPIASAALVLLVVAGLTQLGFSVANSFAAHCTPSGGPLADGRLSQGKLSADAFCLATGVGLREGILYQVSVVLDDAQWKDPNVSAGVQGAAEEPASLWPLIPFRRHVTESWFRPIARIGADGSDEYALHPAGVFTKDGSKSVLVARIAARRDGELFLFVNDAVYPWPFTRAAYRNNGGVATINVRPVGSFDPEAPERRAPGRGTL